MSNVGDFTKIFTILAKFGANNEWVDSADSDTYGTKDGEVSKSEFRKFIKANWDGNANGEYDKDLVNNFFNSFDVTANSNKTMNKLDKKEQATLGANLEIYVEYDEYVKDNVEIPSELKSTGSAWKSGVLDDLSAELNKFIAMSEAEKDGMTLADYLDTKLPHIEKKHTALCYSTEYVDSLKNDVLKDYPEYKPSDDATLNKLIEAYVQNISTPDENGDLPEVDVISDIENIINTYLATAELGNGGDFDLASLGFDATNLTDIQTEVIKKAIKDELASEAKNYEGFENEFNNAVQKFIEAKIKEGGTFAELKAAASEFATSEFKTQLDNLVALDKTYRDVVEGSEFYNRLVTEFGENLANKIAKNDRYIKEYQNIINDVLAKVNAGEMTMEEVADYVVEQIAANLEKFIGNMSDMSIQDLNDTYDKLVKAADEQKDNEASLKQHREAAIKYCDALTKKSGALKQAVIDIFEGLGYSSYKTAINEMLPGDIQDVIAELKEKALTIGDVNEMTEAEKEAFFAGIESEYTTSLGATQIFYVANSGKCGNSVITSDRIKYQATGCITIDSTGKATIDTNTAGTYTGTVTILVDGKKVHSKTITVTVGKDLVASNLVQNVTGWSGTAPEGVTVMYEANGNNVGEAISGKDFATLYNNDNIICLGCYRDNDNYNWGKNGANVVKSTLLSLGSYVVDTIANSNKKVDKDLLTQAMNNVVDKYAVNPTGDYYKKKDSGKTAANFYNYMVDNKDKVKNGLVQVKDSDGADSNAYGLYFKEFVDAIIAEYNRLAA